MLFFGRGKDRGCAESASASDADAVSLGSVGDDGAEDGVELSDFDESVDGSVDGSDRPLVNLAVVLGKKAAEARAAELAAKPVKNPVTPAKPVKPLSARARRRLPVVAAALPHAPLVWSWDDWRAVCGEDRRRARRAHARSGVWLVVALVLICSSLFIGLRPFALQAYNTLDSAYGARAFDEEVAQWPSEEQKAALEAAEAYNAELAASPQTELGEGADPFGDDPDVSRSQSDERYQSLLSLNGSGAMATIEIPSISVYLTIAHGTSDEVLTSRAGHLYGTSLPVGGESTNSVIAAHRGLPDKLMFTRVDELRSGDVMYIHVLGETLGYKVFDVQITDPDDTTYLTVEPGRDLLTLFTCTPYGVNTQRLIIRAERAVIPTMVPDAADAPGDPVLVGLLVFLLLALPLLVLLRVWSWLRERHLRPYPHPHHAAELWFDRRGPRRPRGPRPTPS
ncbi:class C sortase [Bifidobacterium eulemuris]|uniref:Class C sortase n=1 Tax=Bifidobacterium eulemuris TaxID=1765219 RepID=A0A261GDN9_9BIFI|nr:class C sortase [Bifidobacterium eulemuris]OZG69538.1 sortase family protein [Bifidobacterium eulemuris]QOL32084.1 class C sortase [Bifidobacterium eulemuris]